jgi:hypothetical protein
MEMHIIIKKDTLLDMHKVELLQMQILPRSGGSGEASMDVSCELSTTEAK